MINNYDALHPQYQRNMPFVKLVRDAVTGEAALKSLENRATYLPSPYTEKRKEDEEKYRLYVQKAEYDNIPANTLESLIGAVNRSKHVVDGLDLQMIDDIDGDGLSFNEMVSVICSELLQVRYCGLLAEYTDLAAIGFDSNEITVAQAARLNLRPSVKLYTRESIINWDFKRINGRLQLSFVVLKEKERAKLNNSLLSETVDSYLILALDEDGLYYQQRYTEEFQGRGGWTERVHPTRLTGNFDFIPFEFCIAGNYPKGVIPDDCGHIYRIASKAIARFQINADMKLAMWYNGAPMMYSSGWDQTAFDVYQQMTGKDYVDATPGSHLPLPEGASAGLVDWKAESSAFFTYLERNAKEIEALGGVFDTDIQTAEETATGRAIDAAERMNVLSMVVSNTENAMRRVLSYCDMFKGAGIEPDITLNREFSAAKLSAQERSAILAEYQTGLITQTEALRQLHRGGVTTKDAETLIEEMTNNGE